MLTFKMNPGNRIFTPLMSGIGIAMLVVMAVSSGCAEGDDPEAGNGDNNGSQTTPFGGFSASDCKDGVEGDEALPEMFRLSTMSDSLPLEGLSCISWQHDGAGLNLDLVNFESGCIFSWEGDATADETGQIALVVENPECGIGACGSCIYDWSFELDEVPADTNLAVNVEVWAWPKDVCDFDTSAEMSAYGLTIPEDAPEGMVCRYVRPSTMEWMSKTGGMNLPCQSPLDGSDGPETCDTGLICSPHPDTAEYPDASLCLFPCEEDAECLPNDLMVCSDGFCQLETIWDPSSSL